MLNLLKIGRHIASEASYKMHPEPEKNKLTILWEYS